MTAAAFLLRVAERCEPVLSAAVADPEVPADLRAAMAHALLGGGKRLRPAICLAAALACGAHRPLERLIAPACGIEALHAYSLVHDDLPAMDDAELRRGRAACHRVFGEALAILAGDALQALAFALVARPVPGVGAAARSAAVLELAVAAGAAGMCGGQALDLAAEGSPLPPGELAHLQALKTGALIRASAVIGGLVGGGSASQVAALRAYGEATGRAFQAADDVLDVPGEGGSSGKATGQDARDGKATAVAAYGVQGARAHARAAAAQACAALRGWGPTAATLRALARFAADRDR